MDNAVLSSPKKEPSMIASLISPSPSASFFKADLAMDPTRYINKKPKLKPFKLSKIKPLCTEKISPSIIPVTSRKSGMNMCSRSINEINTRSAKMRLRIRKFKVAPYK